MTVFLTGATGYLGQALVRDLRARRQDVRALLRPQSDTQFLDLSDIETALGDIRDPASLRTGMAGCKAVIHAAALTGGDHKLREYEEVNVQGLRNVLDAAWHHKVGKVVHVSCLFALGPTFGAVLNEDHRMEDRRGAVPFETSIRLADRMTQSYLSGGLPLAVVYPGILYGPGPLRDGNLISHLILDRAKGRVGSLPADGQQRMNLAFVDDVASGICRAMERTQPGDRILLGGDNVALREFFTILAAVAGARAPAALRRAFGTGAGAKIAALRARFRGRPRSRMLLDLMEHDWAYDSSLALEKLGFDPRGLREGLKQTVDYLLRKRHLA